MTINKVQFRILVVLGFLFGLSSLIVGSRGESTLPIVLQDYLNESYEKSFSFLFYMFVFVSLIAILSYFGIFFFLRFTRSLYTVSYILSCAGMVFFGPVIKTGIEQALGELSTFFAGLTVALMYFSDIKYNFNKKQISENLN